MIRAAIIPARGGSQRVPGKNKRMFHGKPIIEYAIKTAFESGLFDKVLVSTDDPDTAEIAMLNGAFAMYRYKAFCVDECGTQEVFAQCAGLFSKDDWICGIYATTPLMLADDLRRAVRCLHDDPTKHYAMAVGAKPLRDAGQFYYGSAKTFLGRKPLLTCHTIMIPIQEKYVCDINTEDDWQRAEKMYADLHGK